MVQTRVTAQGCLGSTPEGRRPQIRGWRAGGSLDVASSTPATPLLSPAEIRELNHAAFASLSYPANRQVLCNPHIGRPGFLVSMSIHPRTALRRGRHAGLLLLRKSGPELAGWRDNTPRPPLVAGGALLSGGGRASVVPDPVRRHRHRRAVVRSHVLITGDECRRTSRGRHSAPRAPQESGATIPGTQRRPGQTHTRARGTIEARPPTRHTPPATNKLPKGRSIFIIPGAAKRHKGL